MPGTAGARTRDGRREVIVAGCVGRDDSRRRAIVADVRVGESGRSATTIAICRRRGARALARRRVVARGPRVVAGRSDQPHRARDGRRQLRGTDPDRSRRDRARAISPARSTRRSIGCTRRSNASAGSPPTRRTSCGRRWRRYRPKSSGRSCKDRQSPTTIAPRSTSACAPGGAHAGGRRAAAGAGARGGRRLAGSGRRSAARRGWSIASWTIWRRWPKPGVSPLRVDAAPVTVKGDPDRLAEAVTNVVANAIQYNVDQRTGGRGAHAPIRCGRAVGCRHGHGDRPRTICRGCSIRSSERIPRAAATRAAPVSVWRSRVRSSSATAGRSHAGVRQRRARRW